MRARKRPGLAQNVSAGVDSTAFFGSIMAGLLLGALADRLFDTYPLFIVIGIIAGSVVGFWRMWQIANRDDDS